MKRECIPLQTGSVWIWTNDIKKQLIEEGGRKLFAAEKSHISSIMGKKLLEQMLEKRYGILLSKEENPLGKEPRGNLFWFIIRRFILISAILKIWYPVEWEMFHWGWIFSFTE